MLGAIPLKEDQLVYIMDEMGLPMSFGKVAKVKKVNVEAKLAETKRPVVGSSRCHLCESC